MTARLARLTEKERRVLKLLVDGKSNREIARCAHVTTDTVKYHLKNIYDKLGVSGRVEAALAGVRLATWMMEGGY